MPAMGWIKDAHAWGEEGRSASRANEEAGDFTLGYSYATPRMDACLHHWSRVALLVEAKVAACGVPRAYIVKDRVRDTGKMRRLGEIIPATACRYTTHTITIPH